MTTFPSIEPFRRSFSFPDLAFEEETAWPGFSTRYKTGLPLTVSGVGLTLRYEDVSEDEVSMLRTHWRGQFGRVAGFYLPAIVWSHIGTFNTAGTAGQVPLDFLYADGSDTSGTRPPVRRGSSVLIQLGASIETVSPFRWRYVAIPEEDQKKGGLYDVTIELESLASSLVEEPSQACRIVTRAIVPTITAAGVAIVPAAAPIKTRPVLPLIATGAGQVQSPSTARIVTRAVVPVVSVTGGGVSISAQVRMQFPMPTLGDIAGALQLPPSGRIRLRGPGGAFRSDLPIVAVTSTRLVTRGRVPAVSNTAPPGTVLFPPPGSITRAVVPIVATAGQNVATPAGAIVTLGRVPTVSNTAPPGTVLANGGVIILRGRVPTFSAAGTPDFPPSGRVVVRGRVPTVTGG